MAPRAGGFAAALLLVLLVSAAPAAAAGLTDPIEQWLPSATGSSWIYKWSDSQYAATPTKEQYTLQASTGSTFRISWTTDGQDNPDGAVTSQGFVDYQRTDLGLVNKNWSATPPPDNFPVLCADASNCGNSVASTHFMLIWGTRSPALPEPLVQGTTWSALGGANNDVATSNRYVGRTKIKVGAFANPVVAAKIQSEVTQAGAIGDPYGSGVRTVYWVRGVGPVKIEFKHTGGAFQQTELLWTNRSPRATPPDQNWLPFKVGQRQTFVWRNDKYMKRAEREQFTTSKVVNNTAQIDVKNLSGPIKVAGSYVFSERLSSGLTNLVTATKAASLAKFPGLGPRSLSAAKRRHFFTPLDFMAFGMNPILPSYPQRGQTWTTSKTSREYKEFGVIGKSKILGIRNVKTRLGTFKALVVRSRLTQKGFPFGSGVRTSWFVNNRGLVKLTFRHNDGSVSTVGRVH